MAFILLTSCNGLSTRTHQPFVFALNLSPNTVSLGLFKGEKVLVDISALAPGESQKLTRVLDVDGAVLRIGEAGVLPSTEWTDPSGTPYSLRFQPGHLYAIVVDPKGQAAVYSLPEAYSDDPRLCVVNVLDKTIAQVQAAPDWAKNVKVYIQDLPPVVPTEFYSLSPKTLGLYWQTLAQAATGSHSTAMGADGKPLRQNFETGHYYLFLAGEGSMRDVTPKLE